MTAHIASLPSGPGGRGRRSGLTTVGKRRRQGMSRFVTKEQHVPAGSTRPLAVIDIDGVVADVRHRLRFLDRRPKDWDGFFAAADQDLPLEAGIARVTELAGGHDVVWLTGRPERL